MKVAVVVLLGLVHLAVADIYMHNLRGSNNRLNERSANRRNANRLFDSQNNNRGGYNVGDRSADAFEDEDGQYRMRFFQSGITGDSEITIQWTNQHGCGKDSQNDPLKMNCNMVLQYRCQDDIEDAAPRNLFTMRNGKSTSTPKYRGGAHSRETFSRYTSRRRSSVDANRALQEPWSWYDSCTLRERNHGLFTADQDLKRDKATSTRQNPNGNRRGYECPEERDYYPYWHPTPWTDAAVLAHNSSACSFYQKNSFNRKPYGMCVEQFRGSNRVKYQSSHNNKNDCENDDKKWVELYSALEMVPGASTKEACHALNSREKDARGMMFMWGLAYDEEKIDENVAITESCFLMPPPVDCRPAEWSRVNHLGDGKDAAPHTYTWKLPHFHSLENSSKDKRCVFRMRYNISTDDYNPWTSDSRSNNVDEVIENNPQVNIGAGEELKLAINTAQFGRTFQDRSHIFKIARRPEKVLDNARIVNLNVRGKRGNIVQTFPAVEYDFVPTRATINSEDLVHIQWTGSNTHNNGNPGGDGQTGDAGEGRSGTDRHNFLELLNPSDNFPRPFESATMYKNMEVIWNSVQGEEANNQKNVAIQLASSGYYECSRDGNCEDRIGEKEKVNSTLDEASPSYAGILARFKKGTYHYVCTRNNSFTNRSQKGQLHVK